MNGTRLLLAAGVNFEERLRGIRGGFTNRPVDPANIKAVIFMIVIPLTLLVAFFVVRQFIQRRRETAGAPAHPMKLFDSVLRRMGVRLTDRYLLRAFARSANLQQPTIVLFSRDLFERSTTRWVNTLAVKIIQNHAAARLSAVAEMAFGPAESDDDNGAAGKRPLPENPFEMPAPSAAHDDAAAAEPIF